MVLKPNTDSNARRTNSLDITTAIDTSIILALKRSDITLVTVLFTMVLMVKLLGSLAVDF